MADHSDDDSEPRAYASPACFIHEVDPDHFGLAPGTASVQRDNIMRWRKNERERLIAQRLAISNDERVDHARRIVDNLDTLLPDLAGLSVSLYWPFRGEVARHLLMRRDGGRQPRTYHWSALGNATALASENLYRPVHGHRTTHHVTVASQWLDPLKPRTTNGLSSNRNACASYGCVDAGGGGD